MRFLACLIFVLFFAAPAAWAIKIDGSELHPFFLNGDVNLYLQAVNLTPAKNDGEITFAGSDSGFYVRSIRSWEAHAGLRSDAYYEFIKGFPTEVLSSLGLVPGGSHFVQFTGYARTESEVDEFRFRGIPEKAAQADLWREGDTATYDAKGGVTLLAGLGTYFGGFYGKVVVFGGFRVYIERKAGDLILVEVRSTKIADASWVLGGLMARVEGGVQNEVSEGKSFEFHLSNPAARAAYEDFVQGHLAPTQVLAQNSDSGIVPQGVVSGVKVNNYSSYYFGTPFFPLIASEGMDQKFHHMETRVDPTGVTDEIHWGTAASFRDTVVFRHKVRTAEGFSAQGDVRLSDSSADFHSAGEAFFERRANYGDVSSLNKVLQELYARTGLDFLKVRMTGRGDIDYTEVRLSLMFGEEFVEHLIAHPDELEIYRQKAQHALEEDYKSGKLQRRYGGEIGQNEITPEKIIDEAFAEMKERLPVVAKALRDGNRQDFVTEYAAFGHVMWSEPHVFRELFEESQKCGLSADFEVSGRKISRYLKRFQWLKKDTCLR